jgi:putative hydrolase of HD superfamily
MDSSTAKSLLRFLRRAEQLKDTLRSAHTSEGRRESVAAHTWRLCLLALLLREEYSNIDFARLITICIVHDLGEALEGDVPAPQQMADEPNGTGKAERERRDLLALIEPLPGPLQEEITALWDEYEAASTPEAQLAKGLDKLETLLQHTEGDNPPDFDYAFNLDYGRKYTSQDPKLDALREVIDAETRRLAKENQ